MFNSRLRGRSVFWEDGTQSEQRSRGLKQYIFQEESKLSIVTKKEGVVVGKRGDCIMKDETQEMDRVWISSYGTKLSKLLCSEIRERYDKIWILERLLRWWWEDGIWNKWSGGRNLLEDSVSLWGTLRVWIKMVKVGIQEGPKCKKFGN